LIPFPVVWHSAIVALLVVQLRRAVEEAYADTEAWIVAGISYDN